MRCSFTGHRPNKLYGYNLNNRQYHQLNRLLYQLCENLIKKCGVNEFLSGGAIGFDMIAFEQVGQLSRIYDIENNLAIPFRKQDRKWFKSDRDKYNDYKEIANNLYYVDQIEGYQPKGNVVGEYSAAKMQLRNQFMVDNSDYIIACWDEIKEGGTWNCINYALKHNKNILHINPKTLDVAWINKN